MPRIERMLNLRRVVYICRLDPELCCQLVGRVFPEYLNNPEQAWILRTAARCMRSNCATWKCRILEKMRVSFVFKVVYCLLIECRNYLQ